MGHLEIPNTWQRESHERCVVDHLLQCLDRKSTRLNSSHLVISYAVFCLKKKKTCILRLFICDHLRVSTVLSGISFRLITKRQLSCAWSTSQNSRHRINPFLIPSLHCSCA